jgi:hypothetical protein
LFGLGFLPQFCNLIIALLLGLAQLLQILIHQLIFFLDKFVERRLARVGHLPRQRHTP